MSKKITEGSIIIYAFMKGKWMMIKDYRGGSFNSSGLRFLSYRAAKNSCDRINKIMLKHGGGVLDERKAWSPAPVITSVFYGRTFKYHLSWDELMEACKKFDRIMDGVFRKKRREWWTEYEILCDDIDHAITRYNKREAFDALVTAIKWYHKRHPSKYL